MKHSFLEFFAGGGMARLGLGPDWKCLLANDIDPKKMETYYSNFGSSNTICCDIADIKTAEISGFPDLAWASFPCQDLSLAGNRLGLEGRRSSTFWGFWSAIHSLGLEQRDPEILVLENVCGLLTSHNGRDFQEICRAVSSLGYRLGATVIDAVHFAPQSRPRLFFVCVKNNAVIPKSCVADAPSTHWHPLALRDAVEKLPADLRSSWIWWQLPMPQNRQRSLADIVETDPNVDWHSPEETQRILSMMSSINRQKIKDVQLNGRKAFGTGYKRTRIEEGKRRQRLEVRFDGIAGCLRTPGGGSSRQLLIVVDGTQIKSRLISVREAARLMGVPDSYRIPENYNDGYHVFGDGLAVPAVAHLAEHILKPLAVKTTKAPKRKFAA